MKVVKFGAEARHSPGWLRKVLNIVKSDKERRFVVVSALANVMPKDTKVTDALIKLSRLCGWYDISASQKLDAGPLCRHG